MVNKRLTSLERELNGSYTENLSINRDSSNPHFRDVLEMLGDRILSLSLRKRIMTS
jgi:hypothetical protein